MRKKLKQEAKEILKRNWKKNTAAASLFLLVLLLARLGESVLLYFLCKNAGMTVDWFSGEVFLSPVMLGITLWFSLFHLLVLVPFRFGVKRFFYRQTVWHRVPVREMFLPFASFRLYRKSLGVYFLRKMYLVFPAIFFAGSGMIPFFGYLLVSDYRSTVSVWLRVFLLALTGVLLLLGMVFFYYYQLRYFLADYLLLSDESLSCRKALLRSAEQTGKPLVFSLQLSFLPYWLAFPLLVVPLFFYPYYALSLSLCGQYFIHLTNRSIHYEKKDSFFPSASKADPKTKVLPIQKGSFAQNS